MPEVTVRGRRLARDSALVMAIINRTPDSFYDHGATWAEDASQQAISQAVNEGADLVDIGGVPASPGPEVSVADEIARVAPTVQWTREHYPNMVISVDTYRAEVAAALCAAGADVINDTWAGWDREILDVAAQYGTGYVCAHTGGLTPRTDPVRPSYADVVTDVVKATTGLAEQAVERGVPPEGILIDPTIDFGKNTWHSLALLQTVPTLVATGWPVLLAFSNGNVIGETLDTPVEDRVTGTLATTAIAAHAGATMFRAHQVHETRQTVDMAASLAGRRQPARVERYLA